LIVSEKLIGRICPSKCGYGAAKILQAGPTNAVVSLAKPTPENEKAGGSGKGVMKHV